MRLSRFSGVYRCRQHVLNFLLDRSYIKNKVEKWVRDINKLSEFAAEEPQAALAAYTKGIAHRWSYVQRTVADTSELFKPLEDAIRKKLIPKLVGKEISDTERRILALPYRLGGLAIRNPMETAEREYSASVAITSQLTKQIYQQHQDVSCIDQVAVKTTKELHQLDKQKILKEEFDNICKDSLSDEETWYLKAATEKGASSWLAALPLKNLGYALNKREFLDSIRLRYGWYIPDMPRYCACGKKNSVDHSLDCKLGGYVHIRHNVSRDTEAKIMKDIAYDVKVEPGLQKISKHMKLATGTNLADNARLDISARGLFSSHELTYFDVRITNPNAPSHRAKSLQEVYRQNEKEKMTAYNDRVLQVEKASFVPLVYTTTGGMSPQCDKTHKRIAELVADKTREQYADVINHIRTRLRFALMKSILVAVRGVRGKRFHQADQDNLKIPHLPTYGG